MRSLKATAFVLSFTALFASSAYAENVRAVMQAPLIVGASVSADYSTASPGKRLALRHTEAKNIETIARGGKNSLELMPLVDAAALEGRTSVIALDLFFWDSVLRNSARSVAKLKQIVQRAADAKIPLVLGDIPDLMGSKQPGRKKLNGEITRLCKAPHGCYLVPLDALLARIKKDGGLIVGDRLVPMRELLPDGLHLSPVASEYIADGIQAILEK
jgi:hypothetical protein